MAQLLNTTIVGTLSTTDQITTDSNGLIKGKLTIGQSSLYNSDLYNLYVNGSADIEGSLYLKTNITASTGRLKEYLRIYPLTNSNYNNDNDSGYKLFVDGDSKIYGNEIITNNLTVGDSSINSNYKLYINGDSKIVGNSLITDYLEIGTADSSRTDEILCVHGKTSIIGDIRVDGNTTTNTLTVDGGATIGGDIVKISDSKDISIKSNNLDITSGTVNITPTKGMEYLATTNGAIDNIIYITNGIENFSVNDTIIINKKTYKIKEITKNLVSTTKNYLVKKFFNQYTYTFKPKYFDGAFKETDKEKIYKKLTVGYIENAAFNNSTYYKVAPVYSITLTMGGVTTTTLHYGWSYQYISGSGYNFYTKMSYKNGDSIAFKPIDTISSSEYTSIKENINNIFTSTSDDDLALTLTFTPDYPSIKVDSNVSETLTENTPIFKSNSNEKGFSILDGNQYISGIQYANDISAKNNITIDGYDVYTPKNICLYETTVSIKFTDIEQLYVSTEGYNSKSLTEANFLFKKYLLAPLTVNTYKADNNSGFLFYNNSNLILFKNLINNACLVFGNNSYIVYDEQQYMITSVETDTVENPFGTASSSLTDLGITKIYILPYMKEEITINSRKINIFSNLGFDNISNVLSSVSYTILPLFFKYSTSDSGRIFNSIETTTDNETTTITASKPKNKSNSSLSYKLQIDITNSKIKLY